MNTLLERIIRTPKRDPNYRFDSSYAARERL
jgi:hypothetical protein